MLKCRMVALELSADTSSFLLPRIKDLAPSVTFTPVEIAFLIEKGYLQYGLERHDVTREIQDAGVVYIEHIIRDIQGEFQTHVGMHADYDRVLLIDGGAAFLKNALPARNFEVIVRPEPEYANARGFQTLTFAKGVMCPCTCLSIPPMPRKSSSHLNDCAKSGNRRPSPMRLSSNSLQRTGRADADQQGWSHGRSAIADCSSQG